MAPTGGEYGQRPSPALAVKRINEDRRKQPRNPELAPANLAGRQAGPAAELLKARVRRLAERFEFVRPVTDQEILFR